MLTDLLRNERYFKRIARGVNLLLLQHTTHPTYILFSLQHKHFDMHQFA